MTASYSDAELESMMVDLESDLAMRNASGSVCDWREAPCGRTAIQNPHSTSGPVEFKSQ